MNLRFLLLISLVSIGLGQFGNNQSMTKAGTTVAQFLKISMDARSSAMGGAVTGQETNLTGIYWNPAGLSSIEKSTLNIEFNNNYFTNNINFLNNSFNTSIIDNYLK